MNVLQKHYTKWKTYMKDYILYDSTDIKFLEKAIDTERWLVTVWVWGQEWRLTKNHA